ncbi:hypothetical protein NPIL_698621 [Nephila pilipes]|uniref:Uncharacterized protein n=1 Tax=Nephila pilipes TaxID=299642 RepID=A0A8X6T884_NEPPI|nr:hypothetical protein NPIL_698621 [Nephila pilipes]
MLQTVALPPLICYQKTVFSATYSAHGLATACPIAAISILRTGRNVTYRLLSSNVAFEQLAAATIWVLPLARIVLLEPEMTVTCYSLVVNAPTNSHWTKLPAL